jgi:hypothetical protein
MGSNPIPTIRIVQWPKRYAQDVEKEAPLFFKRGIRNKPGLPACNGVNPKHLAVRFAGSG